MQHFTALDRRLGQLSRVAGHTIVALVVTVSFNTSLFALPLTIEAFNTNETVRACLLGPAAGLISPSAREQTQSPVPPEYLSQLQIFQGGSLMTLPTTMPGIERASGAMVPEPTSLALMGIGLAVIATAARRRMKRRSRAKSQQSS